MKRFMVFALIFLIAPASTWADETSPSVPITSFHKHKPHQRPQGLEDVCNSQNGPMTSMDIYTCAQDRLEAKEKEMNGLIKQAIEEYKSSYGEKDISENQKRMFTAQKAWETYVNEHCSFGYYTEAPIHSPSQSANNENCRLSKTEDRIKEIKQSYLGQTQ